MSKRVRKDGILLRLAGLLLRISPGLRPLESLRSRSAGPQKTPSFPPLTSTYMLPVIIEVICIPPASITSLQRMPSWQTWATLGRDATLGNTRYLLYKLALQAACRTFLTQLHQQATSGKNLVFTTSGFILDFFYYSGSF